MVYSERACTVFLLMVERTFSFRVGSEPVSQSLRGALAQAIQIAAPSVGKVGGLLFQFPLTLSSLQALGNEPEASLLLQSLRAGDDRQKIHTNFAVEFFFFLAFVTFPL